MAATICVYKTRQKDMGYWGGQEALAARNYNRVQAAVSEAIPDTLPESLQWEILTKLWNDWGSEPTLLTLTDEEIQAYVSANVPTD